MSCVCILTPVVIAAWPAFSAAVAAAASSLGYVLVEETVKQRQRTAAQSEGQVVNLEIANSEVVTEQLGRDQQAIVDLMRETASMIEWTGDHATEELVNVHRELCRWRRIWPLEPARSLLAFRARQMSERVLDLSGLASNEPR